MSNLNNIKALAMLGMVTAFSATPCVEPTIAQLAPTSNYFAKGCCRWDDRVIRIADPAANHPSNEKHV